jgi:hypothetical protein
MILILIGLAWIAMQLQAQAPQPTTLAGVLQKLQLEDREITLTFVNSPIPSENTLTLNARDLQIGEDYLCFAESWNNTMRSYCTPLINIAHLSFLDSSSS